MKTKKLSRRQLLKISAGLGASSLLAACVTTTSAPQATTAPAAEAATTAPTAADMGLTLRDLKGKVSFAYKGGIAPAGAPPTVEQEALAKAMAQYKQFQPNVEVEIVDVPAGVSDEAWSRPLLTASQAPDLFHVDNAAVVTNEVAFKTGAMQAVDMLKFADEINPYSGAPWRNDWGSEKQMLARTMQNAGEAKYWTQVTNEEISAAIFTNMDLLQQFGATEFPKTYGELFDLCQKINEEGAAQQIEAWDTQTSSTAWHGWSLVSNLSWDLWKKGGGGDDPAGTPATVDLISNKCTGLWAYSAPEIKESLGQLKRYIDSHKGGAAAYFAANPDTRGQKWLNGRAVFYLAVNRFLAEIKAAETSGTFQVKNWAVYNFPNLTTDDLADKSLTISFDGAEWNIEQPILHFNAIDPRFRKSGTDENVDLLVRDLLQFFTSTYGAQVVIAKGGIPQNPASVPLMDPRAAKILEVRNPKQKGIIKGPGDRIMRTGPGWDKVLQLMQGWMLGQMSYDDFATQATEEHTRALVQNHNDNFAAGGLEPLDKACVAFGALNVKE